jgi:5-methylcytosine-specific restriction protein A
VLVTPGYCDKHEVIASQAHKQTRRALDARRGNATVRGYGFRWRQYRVWFLSQYPLCVHCEAQGIATLATEVDHIVPVTGADDPSFWETSGHQALCKSCHSTKTARENAGFGNRRHK